MKKLEVSVRDKNTLVLESDGIKGDIIDLRELKEFDTVALEEAISKGTDLVYKKKLEEYKNVLDIQNKAIIDKNRSDYELQIKDLKNQIESQNDRSKEKLNEEISKLNAIHKDEINKLKNELDINRQTEKSRTDLLLQEQKNRFDEELNNLKNELDNIKTFEKNKQEMLLQEQKATFEKRIDDLIHQMESNNKLFEAKIKEKELELTNRYDSIISKKEQEYINSLNNNERELEKTKAAHLLEIEKKINELKEEFNVELRKKDDEINLLQRQKASLNVKQTGEDLEAWCDNTVKEAFQNGFECCTWTKDNDVIKEEGENNGSKADYIFRCYATPSHNDYEEITSICMDMKDENPDSVNKKTNESYYKKLDKNRNKKTCKYAVLVSNLEMDKPNALPMWKVREYPDMYVVRPAYLMTFLNIITSLSKRYSDLILKKAKEEIDLKDKLDILSDFQSIKNTYLDKQLILLEKDLSDIIKNNQAIKDASEKISQTCDHIAISYIQKIEEKINTFEIKLNRDIKKIEKLD